MQRIIIVEIWTWHSRMMATKNISKRFVFIARTSMNVSMRNKLRSNRDQIEKASLRKAATYRSYHTTSSAVTKTQPMGTQQSMLCFDLITSLPFPVSSSWWRIFSIICHGTVPSIARLIIRTSSLARTVVKTMVTIAMMAVSIMVTVVVIFLKFLREMIGVTHGTKSVIILSMMEMTS